MELKTKDIVDAVRERGLDWLFQTLHDNYTIEAEYFRKRGKKPFKIRAVEIERLKPEQEGRSRPEWHFYRSILLVATEAEDFPDDWPSKWPQPGDRVSWGGRSFKVDIAPKFTTWWTREGMFMPAYRVFLKEITENKKANFPG